MFNYKSKIGFANAETKSLKVGIPKEVVKILDVKPGDFMDWEVDVEDNEITVTVRKLI